LPQPPFHNPIGSPFVELQSVDSTNNYARQLLRENYLTDRQKPASHGMAIFAHEQVAGKGQRGKIWNSEKGANIALSILVKPQSLQLAQQFQLSACVAVALQHFFAKYAGEDTKIKWPNDLYWQDRKAGGILIESIIKNPESGAGTWDWSIIGIGININQGAFPIYLANPVSLKQITGKNFDPVTLAKEICEELNKKFEELILEGFEKIYKEYLTYLYKINENVKFRKDNRLFEATIKGVTPQGRLLVAHSIEEEFDFGEVEFVIS